MGRIAGVPNKITADVKDKLRLVLVSFINCSKDDSISANNNKKYFKMSQVKVLINSIEKSRASYLNTVQILSKENIKFKKDEYSWNIIEITEHLYWAEFWGLRLWQKF